MNLMLRERESTYIDSNANFARSQFNDALYDYISRYYNSSYTELVIVCIGTDRSTGDSLGPLVGHKLSSRLKRYTGIHIVGTLKDPIHAKNLESNIDKIYREFKKPFVIAIDACLGSMDHIGSICISNSPLKPGSGVNKVLPPVGDISVVGIVNTGGFMEYMVLQSTRLNIVMVLAEVISAGFVTSIWKLHKD